MTFRVTSNRDRVELKMVMGNTEPGISRLFDTTVGAIVLLEQPLEEAGAA